MRPNWNDCVDSLKMTDKLDASCPGCGAVGIAEGATSGETVFRCSYCNLLYYEKAIREQTPTDVDWWKDLDKDGGLALKKSLAQMRQTFRRQLTLLQSMTGGRRLMDVGAGGGVFLAAAKECGWEVLGLDNNPYAAQAAQAAFDISIVSSLDDIPGGTVSVVRLSHVLEHVAFPVEFLHDLRPALHADGIAVIIVPNAAALTYTIVNNFRRMYQTYPRLALPMSPGFHPLGFTPRALTTVAKRAGFILISVQSVSMSDRTYYPWFYDGLLRRVPLSEISLKSLIRYWAPLAFDSLGNQFGHGQWLVAYFRREA